MMDEVDRLKQLAGLTEIKVNKPHYLIKYH